MTYYPNENESNPPLKPGDRVQLTGAFLKNTGQLTGPEGLSRWLVIDCTCGMCQRGRYVAVDQTLDQYPPAWRHIARANLQRVGELRAQAQP